mmetsp:Transcript_12513/g.30429  ORF Transcript_12513/g.30429 Transcript_12513/m.30429 type:complete len:100 (+) Transcript_12513:216-515(+)
MDFDNGANDQAEVMAILKQQKKILGEKKAKDAKEMKEKKQKQVQQTGNRSKRAGLMFPVGMIDRKLVTNHDKQKTAVVSESVGPLLSTRTSGPAWTFRK